MNYSDGRLSKKERDFCSAFVSCGNAREAAYSAGYCRDPKRESEKLLCRKEITDEIKRISAERSSALSKIGCQELAFGSAADAVSLLFMSEPPDREELRKMNLLQISEIKRTDRGAVEIKFFDRLKALEMLGQVGDDQTNAASLYDAISQGAAVIGNDEDEN